MYSFQAEDVNEALYKGITYLLSEGIEEKSRNGSVIVAPGPVCTEYLRPRNRVLYSPTRDANCFFHFFESLFFMSGEYSIEFPCYFNKSYSQFSDDGVGMWDGYGWRWRQFFGWDQLPPIIDELKANPGSRRCVLSMWDGGQTGALRTNVWTENHPEGGDFYVATHGGKAVPCNTHAYLDCRGGVLNMTICNRSNDIIFGCYGANAVHMSILQEYIAAHVGVPVGMYRQFSNNFHAYTDVFSREKMERIADESKVLSRDPMKPLPGPAIVPGFDADLKLFMPWAKNVIRRTTYDVALNVPQLKTAFMYSVVVPMFLAWTYRKWKDWYSMNICLDGIDAPDWKRACAEWVERRHTNKETRPL